MSGDRKIEESHLVFRILWKRGLHKNVINQGLRKRTIPTFFSKATGLSFFCGPLALCLFHLPVVKEEECIVSPSSVHSHTAGTWPK